MNEQLLAQLEAPYIGLIDAIWSHLGSWVWSVSQASLLTVLLFAPYPQPQWGLRQGANKSTCRAPNKCP